MKFSSELNKCFSISLYSKNTLQSGMPYFASVVGEEQLTLTWFKSFIRKVSAYRCLLSLPIYSPSQL